MLRIKKEKQLDTVVTIYEFVAIWCGLIEIAEIKNHRNKGGHHENLINVFLGVQKPPTVMAEYCEATLFGCDLIKYLVTDKETFLFPHSNYDRFYEFSPENEPQYSASLHSADHRADDGCELYFDGYVISNLTKWVLGQYDIPDKFIPEWAKQLSEKPEQTTVDITDLGTNSDYVKVSELTKIMQFMVEIYQDKSLQRTTIENRDKNKNDYLEAMHEKLNPTAINQGITYINKKTTYEGLSKAAVEQMMLFILEDKNN